MERQNSDLSDWESASFNYEEDAASSVEESNSDESDSELSGDDEDSDTSRDTVLEIVSMIESTMMGKEREVSLASEMEEEEESASSQGSSKSSEESSLTSVEMFGSSQLRKIKSAPTLGSFVEELISTKSLLPDESNSEISEDQDSDEMEEEEESSSSQGGSVSSEESSLTSVEMAGRSQLRKINSAPTLGSFIEESSDRSESDSEDEDWDTSRVQVDRMLSKIERSLAARECEHQVFSLSPSMFVVPSNLRSYKWDNYNPKLVSIGPCHNGKLRNWEKHKLYFVNRYKLRSQNKDSVKSLVRPLFQIEQRARDCYAEVDMSSEDFVKMMLFDGCFLVELFHHLIHHEGEIDVADPILNRPWLIPKLLGDLLLLENQLPFFVLKLVSEPLLNNQSFQSLKRSINIIEQIDNYGSENLLDFFHSCLNPLAKPTETSTLIQTIAAAFSKYPGKATSPEQANRYQNINAFLYSFNSFIAKFLSMRKGSYGATESVSHLGSLGIKFKSSEAINFLDIKFKNNVLEIPSIKINDFMANVLLNCVAWERAHGNESKPKYVSDYVYFMGCLLDHPSDVAFLRSTGIICRHSRNDGVVCELFKFLGKEVGSISRDSYLSQLLTELQWYENSPRAAFYMKFISDPLLSLPIYVIPILILTLVQIILRILSNWQKERS